MANNIISRLKAELGLDKSKFKKGLKDSEKDAKKFGGNIDKIGKNIGAAFAGYFAFDAIIRGFKSLIETNRKFEKSLSTLQSITGVTREELKFYAQEAKRMGATTTQSASQVADAFALIGSKKPDLLESKEALSSVTEQAIILAEAANIDVVQAATALTNSLNQMGKSADFAGEFINTLAAGSKVGAANIPYLNAAIEKSGATAASVGLNFNQLTAAIETIAPKIAEPTTAGLQLRQVLIKLAAGVDKFNPKVVGLATALKNLQKEQLSINDLTKQFGIINVNAAKALIDGADAYVQYESKVSNTNTALDQQKINVDNLDGAINSLSSAWEGFILRMQKGNGVMKSTVDFLATYINRLNGLTDKSKSEGAQNIFDGWKKQGKLSLDFIKEQMSIVSDQVDELDKGMLSVISRRPSHDFIKRLIGSETSGDKAKRQIEERIQLYELLEKALNKELKANQDAEIKKLNLSKKTNEELAKLKIGASKDIIAAISAEESKRISAISSEIVTIKSIEDKIKELKTQRKTASTEAISGINQEIIALTKEKKLIESIRFKPGEVGLPEIPKGQSLSTPISLATPEISGLQTRLGNLESQLKLTLDPRSEAVLLSQIRDVKQKINEAGGNELPTKITVDGTVAASEQFKTYANSVNQSSNAMMMAQNNAAAYGSVLSSVGQIAQVSGDNQMASILNVAATTIQAVAQMIPALFSQATASAVASGAALPFPANIAAIAGGVAAVVSAFSEIGGGGTVSTPVTSIDTRRSQPPTTTTRSTSTTSQQQTIKVEVEGRIDNKTIALANKQGVKQLNR